MRRVNLSIVFILSLFILSGCAGIFGQSGTSTTGPEIVATTYEGIALGLNGMKAYIKGQEISKQLTGLALDEKIAQWETARKLFIAAGDALKESLTAPTPEMQNQKIKTYNDLIQKAALELGKLEKWKGGNK